MAISKYLLLLFCLFACNNPTKIPDTFNAKVIGVKDGDTIEVLKDNRPIAVRLADIDCPEKSQPFGSNAKKFTSDFCFGKEVTVISKGKYDRYKRLIATITIDSISLNKQLVINGYAWHFKKYSDNNEFAILEQEARQLKKGLWADNNSIPPWEWRKPKK